MSKCKHCKTPLKNSLYGNFCSRTCINHTYQLRTNPEDMIVIKYQNFSLGLNHLGIFVLDKSDDSLKVGGFKSLESAINHVNELGLS